MKLIELRVRRRWGLGAAVKGKCKGTKQGEHPGQKAEHHEDGSIGAPGDICIRVAHARGAGVCRFRREDQHERQDAQGKAAEAEGTHVMIPFALRRKKTSYTTKATANTADDQPKA